MNSSSTIAALSTAYGKSAIGIIRVSGKNVLTIIRSFLSHKLLPRVATNTVFIDTSGNEIDDVIAIYYEAPNSYTGEDMLEIQCHGNPVILDHVLSVICRKYATHSKPGEFTERAFLNNKIDLAQAEAIADIINASNINASKAALISLQGSFSTKVESIDSDLISLRAYIEASINFPEDNSPDVYSKSVSDKIDALLIDLSVIIDSVNKGIAVNQKPVISIVGKPNVGKSSLANILAGEQRSIVSDNPGTTRDSIPHDIYLDKTNITLIDTAGIRHTDNSIESAGITMTKEAITRSSLTLYLIDETVGFDDTDLAIIQNNNIDNYWLVVNKIDLSDNPKPSISNNTNKTIRISVLEKIGIDLLVQELSSALIPNDQTVGTARARHLGLLNNVTEHLYLSKKYNDNHQIDLVAEELRIAHQDMLRIKGGDINEDLLDKIFSEFCIGK